MTAALGERKEEALMDVEWLTVQDVATQLRINPATVRKWLREGRLRGVNFGGPAGWRIRREDLDRFIGEQESAGQK